MPLHSAYWIAVTEENMNEEELEARRRSLQQEINDRPLTQEELEVLYGSVWDTAQLQEVFTVQGFLAPFCVVTRKSDGVQGSVTFQHSPRLYYNFLPDI